MSAYVLIMREANTDRLESVLGVYTSWQNGWGAFFERWKKGGHPFIKGIVTYTDKDSLYYAVSQANPQLRLLRIYSNDFVVVNIERFSLDTPIIK
ncbi:MAG TPA: hypothetical protein VK492_12045 [Chitinophagaceae bacterium]|nr:hypothetical protein [Chitinophagaceae bacterium]